MDSYARVSWGLVLLWMWTANGIAAPCVPWVTRVVSIEGTIEVKRLNQGGWSRIQLHDQFCAGDSIRANVHSRAGLLLRNETLLRLDQNTTLVLPQLIEEDSAWLDLVRGAVHFISNVPYRLKIKTPFVNAAIEGTEFAVRVSDADTKVWVLEGKVLVDNPQGSISLGPGDAAVAEAGKPPVPYLKIKPRDAVQWALYYPPIIDYRPGTTVDPQRQRAVTLYRTGQIPASIEALNSVPDTARDSSFFTQRAALLLTVGQVQPAQRDIEKALALSPSSGAPRALQSVIALTQNDKDKAMSLAQEAVKLEPKSPTPQVALSYAQQAAFDLEGARGSIKKALELAPDDPLAWARLSELELSTGELDDALDAAKKAEALDPELSRTQMVLGFAQLTEIDIDEAKESFSKAIELDPSAPLPRLGMGLAKIRQGDVEEGRKDIEVAAVLDPENSLIRSYLGKAYYEEKRGNVASREFAMAKQLDPKDPTPWFYDAIYKQTVNRPVEALHDLQRSIELNDNRVIYRSRLLLDEDLAARSSALARIYQNLNFENLGLLESWKSINRDPTNFSAHRFLSESFAFLPRHEIAQSSELLQAQLLQPINITPLQAQLTRTDLSAIAGVGATRLGSNEFNPLFNSNRIALQVNGLTGSRSTWGDDIILSGIQDGLSVSSSQFHFENSGFRENDRLKQDSYRIFTQMNTTPAVSIQAEFSHEEIQSGDVPTRLTGFHDDKVQEIRRRTMGRVGLHYEISPQQDIIVSAIFEENTELSEGVFSGFVDTSLEADSYELETQHLFSSEYVKTIVGGGFVRGDRHDVIDIVAFTPPINILDEKQVNKYYNGYFYSLITPVQSLTATLGFSYDNFEEGALEKDQFSPKFGLLWNPFNSTTVRAAAFRVLRRPYTANQTIEPTQVAGFNQFFDDNNGANSWRYGIGIDQKIGSNLFVGIEASWRDIRQPVFSTKDDFTIEARNEQSDRVYLYWTQSRMFSFSAEYQYQYNDRSFDLVSSNLTNPTKISTHIVPLSLNFFNPNGVFASVGGTYVDQQGDFVFPTASSSNVVGSEHDSFWIFDVSIGYRFPNRLGLVNVSVSNIFNNSFLFQDDTNPGRQRISRFRPERTILGNIRFNF